MEITTPHNLLNLSDLSLLDLVIVASYADQHKTSRFLLEIYNEEEGSQLLDLQEESLTILSISPKLYLLENPNEC